MPIGSALSVGLIGLQAFVIDMQAFVSPGLPYFSIIGQANPPAWQADFTRSRASLSEASGRPMIEK